MRRNDQTWFRGTSPYPWGCQPLYRPQFNIQPLMSPFSYMQFSAPDHRFQAPRMPYHPNPPQRGLLSSSGPRGGSPWQQPFHRNHPSRRRHHLDDIFLPNHDDEEHSQQEEEGFHSRHSNYRPPIRIEVKTTKPETITRDQSASISKPYEKFGDPKLVTSSDSRRKIKDNIEINKQSNKLCVKDVTTASKSCTVTRKENDARTDKDKSEVNKLSVKDSTTASKSCTVTRKENDTKTDIDKSEVNKFSVKDSTTASKSCTVTRKENDTRTDKDKSEVNKFSVKDSTTASKSCTVTRKENDTRTDKDNSEVNKLSVKDSIAASKSCTVTKKVNETRTNEDEIITIQKTAIIDNILEKKCDIKTNASLPKVSETIGKEPVSKDKATSKDSKVILHRHKESLPGLDKNAKNVNQSEIEVNQVKKITSSYVPEKSIVIHGNDVKKPANALRKQECVKPDSNLTNTEAKGNEFRKDTTNQVKKQFTDVAVPEIMGRIDKEIICKSAGTTKGDTTVSLKDKSSKPHIIRKESFQSKSKIDKVTDKTISDANIVESKKSTSDKILKIQLHKNYFAKKDDETLPNRECATGSATKIVKQKSNCTNNENKIVPARNEGKSENSQKKLQEIKNLSNNTYSNKTKVSSQIEKNTSVTSMAEEIGSETEIDIVKELEALVNEPDIHAITATTSCKQQPSKDSNNAGVNSGKATQKMTEENLTQDNPTSLQSSPQTIKKDITIKLIRSPWSERRSTANNHLRIQKSTLSTVDSSPLSKSPLATNCSTTDKTLNINDFKRNNIVLSLETIDLAHPKNADNSVVSKPTDNLTSNGNLKKMDINSNNGFSRGSISDVDGCKNPPILEDIFILEDALKSIDAAPEIIEIPGSPPSNDSKTKSNNNVKDDIIDICSTPKRRAIDLDDVEIIEEKCCTIEIIDDDDDDDDDSNSTIINDKKSTNPTDLIKIESPDDFERYSKSPNIERSGERNRPVEDFCNLDTRSSFLWTFHQRFDDPRTLDMDISQPPSPSPSDISAEPVRLDQENETDRVIHNRDGLWNEISNKTNSTTPNNVELKDSAESNIVNKNENVLTNVKLSSKTILNALEVDKYAKTYKHKKSSSSDVKVQEEKNNSKTLTRRDSVYNVPDTSLQEQLPSSKKVKIGKETAENFKSLPSFVKNFKRTPVSHRNGQGKLFRRSSFSHNGNINNSKLSLRKIKSLDDIVSLSKVTFSHSKAPIITEKLKSVTDNESCIQKEELFSESSLNRKPPTEHSIAAPLVDYKDELLSLLSSSGYQDQIDYKINCSNKEIADVEGISKKTDLTPNSTSNKPIIDNNDDPEDSSIQKKRKRVRRIESSDEESTDVTPKILDKDQPSHKKQKSNLKEKVSVDDKTKKKRKEPEKDVEVYNALHVNEKSRENFSTKVQLPSLKNKVPNNSPSETESSTQSPTKYVTKAEYVKTFAQKKSLVPNISLSIEPTLKMQKIQKRRATFTCEADNEKILRKVVSGASFRQKFLDLFGSISDDEEELIHLPSKDVGNSSSDKDKKISKIQIAPETKSSSDNGKSKKDKADKKRKKSYTSKPFIEDCGSSDNDISSKRSKKLRTSTSKNDDISKGIKVHHESLINNKEKISDGKQIPQLKDKNVIIESSGKLKRQKSNEANVHKGTKDKSSLDSRRTSSSSTESRSKDDKYPKDKGIQHKEKIDSKKDERKSQSKESDPSSKSDVEKCRRKSISKERKIVEESNKRDKNGSALKQKQKELTKLSCKNGNNSEDYSNLQLLVTESNQKPVNESIHKDDQNSCFSDNSITDGIQQISNKLSNKINIIQELKVSPKNTKGSSDPFKRLQESCRRNSAPDVLSSSSETSLIIGEIEDLPLLYRASEGEINEIFQICQYYTPPVIKYDKITKISTVDMECVDKVHITEPIKTHSDVTTKTQKDDEDDVIEIRPDIPVIDLTEEDVRTNLQRSPKETFNNLLLEAKKEIEELAKDEGTITLYRSEEADGNQDEDVQAVAVSISLGATETNSLKIKNDKKLPPASSSQGCLEVSNNNVSNDKTPASLDNTPKEKLPDEALEKASPTTSELFTNLVQNLDITNTALNSTPQLEITNTARTDNTNLENLHRINSTTEIHQSPVVLDVSMSLLDKNHEASISLQVESQEDSMSLEDENQRAISSILDILQSNQCEKVNSRGNVQSSIEQNARSLPPVLLAKATLENTVDKNVDIEKSNQFEQARIDLQPNNITSQKQSEVIFTKESSVHRTDPSKITEQQNHIEIQNNTAECQMPGISNERQELNQTSSSDITQSPRQIVRSTEPVMPVIGQDNLDRKLSSVQNQIVNEDSFGQHRGLPQTLRQYMPTQRPKVSGTFVPPLININSTRRSPRKDQMTQTRTVGIQSTQAVNSENNQLSTHDCQTVGNQVIDLTEDHGELSASDKKIIVDIFTRHSFFLAHLCRAQNGYIEYLKQQSFCPNYFKAEIVLFEEQKQARLLSQSLRLVTELQNLNIRATQNLGDTAFDIVDKVYQILKKKDMPTDVTKSMVFLLLAQLIKPQMELFTRIPLLKALIRICNLVVNRLFSKIPGPMTEEQRKILTYQVAEYNRLTGNSALPGNQLATTAAVCQPNNYIPTDISQSRNNSITGQAKVSVKPSSQDGQSRNASVHQFRATNQSTANTIQSTPIRTIEQPIGSPRRSLLNSGGSLSVRNPSTTGPPNITRGRDNTVPVGMLPGMNQSPSRPSSMNPPSFNVSMMRQHRFTSPRQPSSFAVPNSFHQSRNLVKPVKDLPGGANTNTLGSTPRYVNNYDMPNHSHVYPSLGMPRRQNLDFTSTHTTPVNSSISPPSVNSQVISKQSSQNNLNLLINSPMLSRLLSDTAALNSTPRQQHPLPQSPQLSSSEPSFIQVRSKQQSNAVPQSPRHISQSPGQNVVFQSPRHTQENIYETPSRQPPSYEESINAKNTSLSGRPEELKKRNENLLNELLCSPDSEPLFAKPSSPINNNFRIKLPFTQPDTRHSSIVHTTRANTLSANDRGQIASFESTTVPITSTQPLLNNTSTASSQLNVPGNVGSPRLQSTSSQPLSHFTVGARPKEAVVLNQGLAALSSIGPAAAMLNSSPQQIQNSQPDANIQNPFYYQPLSTSSQLLVDDNNDNQRKSPILIINDSAITQQPQYEIPVVAYHQTAVLPQYQPPSSSVNPVLENSNQSKSPKNLKFHVVSKKAYNQPKANESKPKSKPKPKPKTKPKPKGKGAQAKQKKGSSSKTIETVDLLSSDEEMTSVTQNCKELLESVLVKRAEAQFQVEISEVTHECIKSGKSVNQSEVTKQSSARQATVISSVPDSTPVTYNQFQSVDTAQLSTTQTTIVADVPVTHNQGPEPQDSHSSIQSPNISVQISQPSTSSGVNRRESINNDEVVPTIDLTWIDDLDDEELQREMDFVFIKTEEPRDEYDQAQERNNMAISSPADSGVSSPPNQGEEDTTVYTVKVQRLCICAATAEYNCVCGEAWYCGRECQVKDWESHQKVCQNANADEDVNEREVQTADET